MMNFLKTIILLTLTFGSYAMAANPEFTVTTSKLEGSYDPSKDYENVSNFDCQDQIVAIGRFKNVEGSILEPVAEWVNPQGDVQERVELRAGVNRVGEGEFYSYIRFSKGAGAGIFSFIDPSMSLEEFIGPWTIRFLLEGRTVASSSFEVIC